jgi:hypothetical protein
MFKKSTTFRRLDLLPSSGATGRIYSDRYIIKLVSIPEHNLKLLSLISIAEHIMKLLTPLFNP